MVDNISFNGLNIPQQSYRDIETVAKYTIGTNIDEVTSSPFDGFGMMLAIGGGIEGFKAIGAVKKGVKDTGSFSKYWANGVQSYKNDVNFTKDLFSNGGWKQGSSYGTLWNKYSGKVIKESIPSAEKLAAFDAAAQAKYAEVAKLAEEATLTGSRATIKAANQGLAEARLLSHGQQVAKATAFGRFFQKAGSNIGRYSGLSSASKWVKGLATKSPVTASLLKHGKGQGIFIAITAAIGLFTEVIPTFSQLGAKKGMKQLGKTTVKTGASVGGWVAGAAIGSAIGSVIPGAGTVIGGAIGALCGLIGGTIGSWAAEKGAEKIVGKNELDIAKEDETKNLIQQAKQDPNTLNQLLAAAETKAKEEGETPETKSMITALNRIKSQTQSQVSFAQNGSYNNQGNNPYANYTNPMMNKNIFASQNGYMDKDFMAMSAGLA